MLCPLCQHGVNKKDTWKCSCGEINCRHISVCSCPKELFTDKEPSDEEKKSILKWLLGEHYENN